MFSILSALMNGLKGKMHVQSVGIKWESDTEFILFIIDYTKLIIYSIFTFYSIQWEISILNTEFGLLRNFGNMKAVK